MINFQSITCTSIEQSCCLFSRANIAPLWKTSNSSGTFALLLRKKSMMVLRDGASCGRRNKCTFVSLGFFINHVTFWSVPVCPKTHFRIGKLCINQCFFSTFAIIVVAIVIVTMVVATIISVV